MKIMPIVNGANFGRKITKHEANGYIQGNCDCKPKNYGVGKFAGIGTQALEVIDVNNMFNVKNISNEKIGSKFILTPTDPKFKDLKILIKPNTRLTSHQQTLWIGIKDDLSFKGRIYGSIRKDETGEDETMKKAYSDFFDKGMNAIVQKNYINREETAKIKDDYNFYIPSDGDGTRYRDITLLQGGVTKPASKIPATLNGEQMSLVQAVLTNYAKTSKLNKGYDFIPVTPAQGSAYAFFEGLASGKIPTTKPLVFSWGDNFSDIDITKLIQHHEKNNSGFTLLTLPVNRDRVQSLGAAKVKSKDNLEITDFYEKPKEKEILDSFAIPNTDNEYLGVVGPYVISPQALTWLKENYINNPEKFKDFEGKVDFSRTVIGNLVKVLGNGELKDKDGNALRMMAYEKPSSDTWSDLGSEKDFSAEMKNVKHGAFSNLPSEMRETIGKNVDRYGNITFDAKTKARLNEFLDKYEIQLENSIIYSEG